MARQMTGVDLRAANTSFRLARGALQRMQSAKSFTTLEDAWREFLVGLEKCWVKTEQCCKSIGGFQQLQSKSKDIRKTDPLLQYLWQARHAEEHTIQDHLLAIPGRRGFGPSTSGDWKIDKLEIKHGEVIRYEGNQPMRIVEIPGRIVLLPVTNRGRTYSPPVSHLGQPIPGMVSPLDIAKLGLAFYERFFADARALILKNG